MSMDLEKAKEEFIKYTEKYNLENENIERKQKHSLRVMQLSRKIAEQLQLSQEEIDLATLIGLLHDIARFEQYTKYKTFRDINSIDHGDYGVKILNKDIRKYIETSEYDDLIKIAIKNHNKFQIENGLKQKEELFSKIVRDADKIDIFYESVEIFWKGKEKIIEESIITESVSKAFMSGQTIKRKKEKDIGHEIDEIVSIIAFIYDLNFKPSFEILLREDYINKIINRYNMIDKYTKEQIEQIRKIANDYIKQKIGE